jgi:hypothetical protein
MCVILSYNKKGGWTMRVFTLNKIYSISCEFEQTRQGFRHVATLLKNGYNNGFGRETKVNYLNRTWECFEFETVLKRCIEDNFEGAEQKKFINKIKKGF